MCRPTTLFRKIAPEAKTHVEPWFVPVYGVRGPMKRGDASATSGHGSGARGWGFSCRWMSSSTTIVGARFGVGAGRVRSQSQIRPDAWRAIHRIRIALTTCRKLHRPTPHCRISNANKHVSSTFRSRVRPALTRAHQTQKQHAKALCSQSSVTARAIAHREVPPDHTTRNMKAWRPYWLATLALAVALAWLLIGMGFIPVPVPDNLIAVWVWMRQHVGLSWLVLLACTYVRARLSLREAQAKEWADGVAINVTLRGAVRLSPVAWIVTTALALALAGFAFHLASFRPLPWFGSAMWVGAVVLSFALVWWPRWRCVTVAEDVVHVVTRTSRRTIPAKNITGLQTGALLSLCLDSGEVVELGVLRPKWHPLFSQADRLRLHALHGALRDTLHNQWNEGLCSES